LSEISLSGSWQLKAESDDTWRTVQVPGCWEAAGVPMDYPGPCVYWRRFRVPDSLVGRRLFLRFGGVSYHCSVSVDGKPVGEHTGTWDTFELEITDAVTPDKEAQLMVKVEKPASLTAGPGSPTVPGRFPLAETLSGFLPYVWGHAFGGIWQDVTLVNTGPAHIEEVSAKAEADGRVAVEVKLDAPSKVYLTLVSPSGDVLAAAESEEGEELEIGGEFEVEDPQRWSPGSPTLYAVVVATPEGDRRVVRFGFRELSADG